MSVSAFLNICGFSRSPVPNKAGLLVGAALACTLFFTIIAQAEANDGTSGPATYPAGGSRSFYIANDTFWRDGEPLQIISGSLHYSRVPPEVRRMHFDVSHYSTAHPKVGAYSELPA